ncbi:2855_t:CDS:2 [Scutellospora calospora]|uniref:2855_t:CDS:1 n=1 Tax=Scutellospora calospora TaxID=85575 RepID=A0ACA9M5Q7_9GLOM|nr:2855_t:CDS:2 [Scutellospora calospora]
MASRCQLCEEVFPSRMKLVIHERIKHRNNKTIPHRNFLFQPPFEQVMFYQDAFIVLVKKRLGFNRHSIGAKQVSIHAFPENIFGEASELRLKQLVNYDDWNVRQDPKLKTIGYVLFMDNENSYRVNFSWTQSEFKENNCIFQYGTVTCKFTADSGEFSQLPAISQTSNLPQVYKINLNKDSSDDGLTQKNYRFILPWIFF